MPFFVSVVLLKLFFVFWLFGFVVVAVPKARKGWGVGMMGFAMKTFFGKKGES